MPDKVIKAKNVVSFSTGEVKESAKAAKAAAPAEAVEAVETAVAETAEAVKEAIVEEAPVKEAPVAETPKKVKKANASGEGPIEINPLNLRQSRYLDENPQDPDWADEEDAFDEFEAEEEAEDLSTLTEVFIPLHDDSTATVIRKGMVIVSVIVIICCLVAIFMKMGSVSGTITPDFPALTEQASYVASTVLLDL